MCPRPVVDDPAASAKLDSLLAAALACAIRLRLTNVAEHVLSAIEAQAAATGDVAARDAAYLYAMRIRRSACGPVRKLRR